MSEVSFDLIGANDFHITAENDRFSAEGSRYHHNLKFENFTSSFGRI